MNRRKLAGLVSVGDVERAAQKRLPGPVWDMIEGGAGDEITLRRNRTAFDDLVLIPHAFADVASRDLSVSVLGQPVSMPLLLCPTGFQRMAHRDAELAVASAAGAADTVFVLSTITSYEFSAVAKAATGPRWFQLFPSVFANDLAGTLARVAEAGYYALCVTIDSPVGGNRDRDARNRVSLPLRPRPRLLAQVARRPTWAVSFVAGGVGRGSQGMGSQRISLADTATRIQRTATSVTLADLARIRELWSGPLVVKGILRGEDCPPLVDLGVDGIVVSNHGARFLDTVPATITALRAVVEAVDGRAEVYLDGGVRRGVDVIKALALGARACLVGRPYIYGLAVGGEQGVSRVLEIFRTEIDRALALVGCCRPSELDPSYVGLSGWSMRAIC